MQMVNLLLFRDAIEHLSDYADGLPEGQDQRRARSAILEAYEQVTTDRRWRYYQVHGRIKLDAAYST
jgi:hypothetical protein